MKILCYNRNFYPSIGGTEASGRLMARELARSGHDLTIVTATELPDELPELQEGYKIVRYESVFGIISLAKMSDMVISRGGISIRAMIGATISGKPLIVFHEMGKRAEFQKLSLKNACLDKLKDLFIGRAALHVGVTDAILEEVKLPAKSRRTRLYNPVSADLWTVVAPPMRLREFDVAFVGRIDKIKGIYVLKHAVFELCKTRDISVAIVGSSTSLRQVRKEFAAHGATVEFLGPREGESLRRVYSNSKILAMPSLCNEGMGMVAAEALASGTPVCASDQPALREVIGSAGLFHKLGDALGLARDLKRLLGEPSTWATMSHSAMHRRDRFAIRAYSTALAEIMGTAEQISISDEASE